MRTGFYRRGQEGGLRILSLDPIRCNLNPRNPGEPAAGVALYGGLHILGDIALYQQNHKISREGFNVDTAEDGTFVATKRMAAGHQLLLKHDSLVANLMEKNWKLDGDQGRKGKTSPARAFAAARRTAGRNTNNDSDSDYSYESEEIPKKKGGNKKGKKRGSGKDKN